MRLVLVLLALLVAPAASAVVAAQAAAQSIIAVVNDDVITDRDVEQRVRLALLFAGQPPTAANAERLRPQVVRQLVDQTLQLQAAQELGIEIPETDVDGQLAVLAEGNNINLERLYGILRQVGVNAETLRSQIRTQLAWSQVAQRRLLPRVVVSDVQLAQNLRQATSGAAEYRLAEIFLPIYAPDQEQRVLDDALRLREAVGRGADFGALAQQVSTAGSAERRGDLGWLPESSLPRELRPVVASLADGGISQPIRTPDGVYLFQRLGRREGASAISVSLRQLDVGETVDGQPLEDFVELLRSEAASCGALETAVAALPEVRLTALEDIDPNTLEEPLATVAFTQPIGVVTSPLRTTEGTLLAMVCDRSGGADPAARERMMQQLQLEGLERLASRYLRNLRQDAFIELRAVPG